MGDKKTEPTLNAKLFSAAFIPLVGMIALCVAATTVQQARVNSRYDRAVDGWEEQAEKIKWRNQFWQRLDGPKVTNPETEVDETVMAIQISYLGAEATPTERFLSMKYLASFDRLDGVAKAQDIFSCGPSRSDGCTISELFQRELQAYDENGLDGVWQAELPEPDPDDPIFATFSVPERWFGHFKWCWWWLAASFLSVLWGTRCVYSELFGHWDDETLRGYSYHQRARDVIYHAFGIDSDARWWLEGESGIERAMRVSRYLLLVPLMLPLALGHLAWFLFLFVWDWLKRVVPNHLRDLRHPNRREIFQVRRNLRQLTQALRDEDLEPHHESIRAKIETMEATLVALRAQRPSRPQLEDRRQRQRDRKLKELRQTFDEADSISALIEAEETKLS